MYINSMCSRDMYSAFLLLKLCLLEISGKSEREEKKTLLTPAACEMNSSKIPINAPPRGTLNVKVLFSETVETADTCVFDTQWLLKTQKRKLI